MAGAAHLFCGDKMDNIEFGLKELEQVRLKTTYPIEVNGVKLEEGETVALFDKIQIANFKEIKEYITAHGGYQDTPRVFWETTKEVQLYFTQGIFSKVQFALMSNSCLINDKQYDDTLKLFQREVLESDENGIIELKYEPVGKIFVYKVNGAKVGSISAQGKKYNVGAPFLNVIVDYDFNYTNKSTTMILGQRLVNGYLTLEGKTRVKDDITGQTHTGIIYIPKLKLMSDLSIKLGENATPVVGNFAALACPTGTRGSSRVMEMTFLEDDIDSDM